MIKALIIPLLSGLMFTSWSGAGDIQETKAPSSSEEQRVKTPIAVVETSMGTIEFELFKDVAPKTVESFINLANKGFYNGLIFHRVIKEFMIQGGDPSGDGTGGPGFTLPAEFSKRKHFPGTVSMARKGGDINSAGSQFFICLEAIPHLDGQYTIFGQTVKGMDVVKRIGETKTTGRTSPPSDKPLVDVVMKKVSIRYEG